MTVQSREKYKIYNNVFDEFTNRNLFKLQSQGYFDELIGAHGLGKEANIFTAKRKDGMWVIVKIYRVENCNFNKMYDYIKSDPRYEDLKGRRREIIFKWVQREYRNLHKAREVGVRVPTPFTFMHNIIVMELIGDDGHPAKQLKSVRLKDPKKFVDELIKQLKTLYQKANIVHADLSPFNILVQDEKPVLIDMSQSTSKEDNNSDQYMERDLDNIITFAAKYDIVLDKQALLKKIIGKK
ncbi:MAG TPA: serine protein kinase RIO [Acidobacteriota bacterium]|nr:serine protein kinase RIO [Acidobacteriota bacterium]